MERCSRITADNYSDCSKDKKKEPWMTYNQVGRGSPLIGGLSWPPRSYYCGFCKREFKSAQALGGHMNVHRRDKARLRQSPPLGPLPFDLNPNPNLGSKPIPCSSTTIPNLNMPPPSSSSANKISLVTSTLPSMIPLLTNFYCSPSSDSRGDDLETMDKVKTSSGLGELKDLMEEGSSNEFQKGSKAVRLDLEIGINGDHTEDIDLELRLGYT